MICQKLTSFHGSMFGGSLKSYDPVLATTRCFFSQKYSSIRPLLSQFYKTYFWYHADNTLNVQALFICCFYELAHFFNFTHQFLETWECKQTIVGILFALVWCSRNLKWSIGVQCFLASCLVLTAYNVIQKI